MALVGRSCLITGGSRGIGLAIASTFAQAGASCTIVARNAKTLADAKEKLSLLNSKQEHYTLAGNVGDFEFWENAARQQPKVDILVNAAGRAQQSLLYSTPVSVIDEIIRTNLLGPVYATKVYLRYMIKQKKGCIINISSALTSRGAEGSSVYAASKAGLEGLTRSMAKEMSRSNIRVNTITPGYVDTDMTAAMDDQARRQALERTPLHRYGTAMEVASAALFIATNDFVSGSNLSVDGGYTCS